MPNLPSLVYAHSGRGMCVQSRAVKWPAASVEGSIWYEGDAKRHKGSVQRVQSTEDLRAGESGEGCGRGEGGHR